MKARKERRLFERTFGRGAATAGNLSNIKSVLSGASKFLGGLSLGKNIHCDFQAETDGCQRGAAALYRNGQIFVCTSSAISKSISPPEVQPREEIVQSGDSSAPGMGVAPSAPGTAAPTSAQESMRIAPESTSKTKERQRKSRERAEAELAALMAHEAVHHIIQPGIIDVYPDERLFQFLGGGGNIARDLTPLALKNPDSIVAFAFLSLAADGSSELPGAEQLLKAKSFEEGEEAGTLSGELEVGPVIGHEKIKLAMALAQEAIEQSGDGVAEVEFVSLEPKEHHNQPGARNRSLRGTWCDFSGPLPRKRTWRRRRLKLTRD